MFEIDDLSLESFNDISIVICVFKFTKTSLKTPYETNFRLLKLEKKSNNTRNSEIFEKYSRNLIKFRINFA